MKYSNYRIIKKQKVVYMTFEPIIDEYYIIQERFLWIFWIEINRNIKETYFRTYFKFNTLISAKKYLKELK